MHVLLTGGTGYIASNTAVVLAAAGFRPVLFDNLSNSTVNVVDRLAQVIGYRPVFVEGDVRDTDALVQTLRDHAVQGICHFAGVKSVAESVAQPWTYYDINVGGTTSLVQAMRTCGVRHLIFSSSATVYGDPEYLPIDEKHRVAPKTPYGWSKLFAEQVLADTCVAMPDWSVVALRYFNPVGGHASGLLDEEPRGIPNNLMPYIARVAKGELPQLQVFGDDYPTPDGTGVRDYIHVTELAKGHLAALQFVARSRGMQVFNLGTGRGMSVLEAKRWYERRHGVQVPHRIAPRRPGDVPSCYADATLARSLLDWRAAPLLDL